MSRTEVESHDATDAEWASVIDDASRLYLGMSGDELRDRIRNNNVDDLDHVRLMRVLMLMPEGVAGE